MKRILKSIDHIKEYLSDEQLGKVTRYSLDYLNNRDSQLDDESLNLIFKTNILPEINKSLKEIETKRQYYERKRGL